MENFIADRMGLIDSSGIRKVFNLAAKMENPINLSIGQPDFDVPTVVKEDMIEAIKAGHNKYTLTQGTKELREKLLDTRLKGKAYGMENLIVTSGVSGGILLSMMVLINPGDELMIFDPYFVMYPHLTRLMGGTPNFVNIFPDFKITKEKLEKAYNKNVKALILNSPANPTGVTATEEEIKIIAEFAKENNIFVISDEIYKDFVYDGDFVSIGDYYENTIVLDGFSKNLAMTGLRLGYAAGPKEILDKMITLQQYTFVCAPSIAQKGIENNLDYDFSKICAEYKEKRDIVYEGLKDKFNLVKPTGAFYAFAQLPDDLNGMDFVEKAIEKNVLVIPSNVFSENENAFRLSFAAKNETLKKGVEILSSLV